VTRTYSNRNKRAPFTIDKGVPMKAWRKSRAKPQAHVAYPFAYMDVTDSFGAALKHKERIQSAATRHMYRHPGTEFTTLRTGANACRCWRTK